MSTEWKMPDLDELGSWPPTVEKLSKLEDEILDLLNELKRLNRVDPHPRRYAKLVKQSHAILKQIDPWLDAMKKADA